MSTEQNRGNRRLRRREARPCVHVLDGHYHLSLHLELPREGRQLLREGARTSKGNWDAVCWWEKGLKQQEEVLGLG